MCLDVCEPAGVARAELERAVALTTRWARRQVAAPSRRQLLFGITGRRRCRARRRSIEEIAELGFDGHALGGLLVGEERDARLDTVEWAAPLLPAERPRYFMGIGDPAGILEVIERGVDMFDCVLPTRMGRTVRRSRGRGVSSSATHGLRGIGVRSTSLLPRLLPLLEGLPPAPRQPAELLGLLLLSVHNVRFLLDVTAGAQVAIERGAYASYKADALARLADARVPAGWERNSSGW